MADSFDLLERPWIVVTTRSGESREISVRDLFAGAHELAAVRGEIPSQSAAVLRLLLAILHRATADRAESPEARWERLWADGRFAQGTIGEYLDWYADRFDLLHPSQPFYQVADLHTTSGKTSGLRALIADVPNGFQFFSTRSGPSIDQLSYAEAARWLVHSHAFDPSGIKSGATGDSRVKSGKGYPIGTGWTGNLGLVIAEGRTLFETLMLNLVLRGVAGQSLPADDRPVWEVPVQNESIRPDPTPSGPVDLLTWQSRRIRLFHDGRSVVDALVCNGDPLTVQDRFGVEFASGWRRSEPQEKKLKRAPVYMPRTHQLDRSFWRGLSGLLPESDTGSAGRDAPQAQPPEVLRWLATVRAELGRGYPVRIRAVGMEYGSNQSVIDEVIDDVIVLRADVLGSPALRTHAVDAVDDADRAAEALSYLAGDLVAAAGGDPGGARTQARASAFFSLDAPYRTWVRELSAETDLFDHRAAWQKQVLAVVERAGAQLVAEAGGPAWVGRVVRDRHLDAALAQRRFRGALNKALPHARTSVSAPAT